MLVLVVRKFSRASQLVALCALFVLWGPFIHKQDNPLYFPVICSQLTLHELSWCAVLFTDEEDHSLWPADDYHTLNLDMYVSDEYCLQGINSFTVVGVRVSNADFGVSLWPILQSNQSGKRYQIAQDYISDGLTKVTITSDDLNPETQYQSRLTLYLGSLMYYPILPALLSSFLD